MPKLLILYYSAFGCVAIVATAIAEGARSAGADVDIKRVAEPARTAADRGAYFNPVLDAPTAVVEDLTNYDAIIVGSPSRFGCLSSPVAAFLQQASVLAAQGLLSGKVGGTFAPPTSPNGGHEAASMSIITNLLHFGMIVAGPPYSAATTPEAATT